MKPSLETIVELYAEALKQRVAADRGIAQMVAEAVRYGYDFRRVHEKAEQVLLRREEEFRAGIGIPAQSN